MKVVCVNTMYQQAVGPFDSGEQAEGWFSGYKIGTEQYHPERWHIWPLSSPEEMDE